jgi:uncharacterized protein (TIGR03067 family)
MPVYKLLLLTAATLSLAWAPAPFPRPDRGKRGLEKLHGTWRRVHCSLHGKPVQMGEMTVEIVGDRMTILLPNKPKSEWTITLDATKKLKVFDFTGRPGPARGHCFLGVFRLDGDTLTVCSSTKGAAGVRPTSLDGSGHGVLLQAFTRLKR